MKISLFVTPLVRPRTRCSAVILPTDVEAARTAFFIWFFGASGAAGIARSTFPKMFKQTMYIQSLKGLGPTQGGEMLNISPLTGYPEDLRLKDVEQILANPLSAAQIVEQHPVDYFLSKKGYLTFEAFKLANPDANPLALRAVFDTFATSTNVCEPDKAQRLLDEYRQDILKFKQNLLFAKIVGFASVFILLFLLGLADIVAAGHAYRGWFPDWPGGQNFPWCIFDLETGPWTIPKYWT